MITRPLDLLTKLRPPPRNYDSLFLVNGGLIALFFVLFGSRFVLSPGLRVNNSNFMLPSSPDAVANATATPVSVSVNANGQIWGDTGLIPEAKLSEWLVAQAKRAPGSTLLVIGDTHAPMEVFTTISDTATSAGFGRVQLAMQAAAAPVAGATP